MFVNPHHLRDRTRRRAPHSRGSAIVELLIILPVLLLIIFAMWYLGELSLFRQRTHFGGEYALDARGDQSEAGALRGPVSDQFYPERLGELTVVEQPPQPPEIPETGEIRDMIDEMCQPIYSTYAVGRYVFSGGQLTFQVQTHQSQALSADGQYANKYHLLDDNIPEMTTELAQNWAERNRVDLTYSYKPEYMQVGDWALDTPDLATTLQAVVRATKNREVRNPPTGMLHQIDAVTGSRNMTSPGRLTDYPQFRGDESFWDPN